MDVVEAGGAAVELDRNRRVAEELDARSEDQRTRRQSHGKSHGQRDQVDAAHAHHGPVDQGIEFGVFSIVN